MTQLDNIINTLTRLFAKTHNTMNPALIALIMSLVEEAIKDAPGVVEDLKLIFNNPNPVPADWEALRAKVLAKGYADYVPASALPPENVVALSTPVQSAPAAAAAPEAPPAPAAAPAAAQQEQPAAKAEAIAPYLPDGSANPAFNHFGT